MTKKIRNKRSRSKFNRSKFNRSKFSRSKMFRGGSADTESGGHDAIRDKLVTIESNIDSLMANHVAALTDMKSQISALRIIVEGAAGAGAGAGEPSVSWKESDMYNKMKELVDNYTTYDNGTTYLDNIETDDSYEIISKNIYTASFQFATQSRDPGEIIISISKKNDPSPSKEVNFTESSISDNRGILDRIFN